MSVAAAPLRSAARRAVVVLATATLLGCATTGPEAPPSAVEAATRPAPRHPIGPADPEIPSAILTAPDDRSRTLTPGPNALISPSPDMAPRVGPASRVQVPSSYREIEELSRKLQEGRRWSPTEPGPPRGTIDLRPGTIRTTPGTIEVPK